MSEYVMVPRELTLEMLEAFEAVHSDYSIGDAAWAAMLAAAPTPPAGEVQNPVGTVHKGSLVWLVDAHAPDGSWLYTAPQPAAAAAAAAPREPAPAVGGARVDYWCAVDTDDCVEFGMSADDGNGGDFARQEMNDWINDQLNELGSKYRLVGLHATPPAPPVDAELQRDAERLDWLEEFVRKAYVYGASFDFAKALEGERGGFRFLSRHRLDDRYSTIRQSIDAAIQARRQQENNNAP